MAATKSLLFDLVGEGTLPHVSIEKPAARSEAGVPMLQFPRLLLERSAKQPLVLRNEGILPATVRVTMPRGTPFFVLMRPRPARRACTPFSARRRATSPAASTAVANWRSPWRTEPSGRKTLALKPHPERSTPE